MSAATLLVAQGLSRSAATLQSEIDAVDHLVGRRPVFTGRVDATAGDLAELAGWARELVITYVDDERPIQQLATKGFWLPDFSKLGWDGNKTAGENLEKTARSDEFGAFVLGTAGALMERYRRFSLHVPRHGSPLPSLNLPRPDVEWRGKPFVTLPNGLVVPQGSMADPEVKRLAKLADDWHQPGKPTFVTNPGLGRPPTWAKIGGRTLGALGAGLTVYDSYMSQWEQDEKYHPEWSTGQRVASAGYNAATEGGGAVAGGLLGAQLGATVGSFVPIPFVGTVGGAIVGGAIGAFVGSKAGKAVGQGLKEGAEVVGEKIGSAWKSVFG
ncbi:hypothetical protein [Cellulomonas fengjieae]|uniref:Glycine zipper domain-containing protein n=1 Tax=Cellulomonas fengjieae TaxID=2819978 RepID=A0ABS3SII7_9CELL|nr:hypothetical protein [Cellulomonas fengjieae]MBO3085129.1 hypothetical protein [Cellulomonas fengjieae]QVI66293.1 hypothetical protein KG102_01325 [Cellulomonas fengjieae]